MARRSSKRKVMQKTGKTEQGKYSAKYALSELIVYPQHLRFAILELPS